MATVGISLTVGTRLTDGAGYKTGERSATNKQIGDQVAALATAKSGADKTAFEAALAQLVTDGATPTQAHVTAANSAYTTYAADIAAVSLPGDMIVIFNTTNVASVNDFKRALDAALQAALASGTLTA